ncbi:MAG: C10 family peptidase [Bacteroides sp.]|nr:C10 family peptidase [Bacteroides sp.]MCM1378818.1 C10 family peptidase [Bacteroides sp.]MCM1445435.1 C10 family peptidase [Prevotella sp.]
MKKHILLLAVAALGSIIPAAAEQLTAEQALARALKTDGPRRARAINPSEMKLVYSTDASELYVFDRANAGGFIIASGDTRMRPLLAVADNGTFDPENESVREWLDFYKAELAAAKAEDDAADPTLHQLYEQWTAIEPICTTEWNQLWPYNAKTPLVNAKDHALTGCVATAMAQVIKAIGYYKGAGSNSYECKGVVEPKLSYDFTKWVPDFSKMPDVIKDGSPQAEIDEIAELMLACGMAVNMGYAASASGATLNASHIKKYFGYDESSTLLSRECYTTQQWETIVYNELAAGRPIYYSGSGKGGHAFVCDGYASDGLFHFNWGWGGLYNGYFALSALLPYASGVAGGFNEDSYSCGQSICLFITPDAVKPTLDTPNKPCAVVYGNELSLPENQGSVDAFSMMWTIFNTPEGKGTSAEVGLGLILKPVDNPSAEIFMAPTEYKTLGVRNVMWNFSANFSSTTVPAGKYDAYVGCAVKGYEGYWPVYYSGNAIKPNVDHWELTVAPNGTRTYALANFKNNDVSVSNMNVNDMYTNEADNYINFTIANLNSYDWNEKISLRVFDAKGSQVSSMVSYPYVSKGQAQEFNVRLDIKAAGKYTAKVYRDSYTDLIFPGAELSFEVKNGSRPTGGKGITPAGTVNIGLMGINGGKPGDLQPTLLLPGASISGTTVFTSYTGKDQKVDYYLVIANPDQVNPPVWRQKVGTATTEANSYDWVKGDDFSFTPEIPAGSYVIFFADEYGTPLSYSATLTACLEKDGLYYQVDAAAKTATIVGAAETLPEVLTIPAQVDLYAVTAIAKEALTNRFALQELTVPASMQSMELNSLRGCAGLRKVTFLGSNPPFVSSLIPFYGIRPGAKFFCSTAAYDNFAAVFHTDGYLYGELSSFDVPAEISVMAGHAVKFTPITDTQHYDPELVSIMTADIQTLQVEYSENGDILLRGIAPGTATLSVECSKPEVKKTVKVTVIDEVTVSLDQKDLNLRIGETARLKATLTPASNLGLTWTSYNPDVAQVDNNGLVTAKSTGEAVIAVYVDGNENPATCSVKVNSTVASIKLDPKSLTLAVGEWGKFTPVFTPESASNVELEWTSSKENVAIVSKDGDVYAVAVGKTVITATVADGSKLYASALVNVSEKDGILEMEIEDGSAEIYDIQGRRVANPGRGLYIVNGKLMRR